MTEVLDIACDEAGYTGADLLNLDQRYFGFGSVCVPDDEAHQIIAKARRDNPVQMPELKGARLLGTETGAALVRDIFTAVDGRYTVIVHDKLLALCGWLFEYLIEPVYKDDPRLLYEKDLHRFVAMFAWIWMLDHEGEARVAVEQFQRYMRTRDVADAPFLFGTPRSADDLDRHPFNAILTFAYGYREQIIADNANLHEVLPDRGRWVLDLSASGLWSHLNHWGRQRLPLRIRSDASKPLRAIAGQFSGDEDDPVIHRARVMGHDGPLGWQLAEPMAFMDSRDHPAIQLADVIASTTVGLAARGFPGEFAEIAASIDRHRLRDCILPDFDRLDLTKRGVAVNWLVLYDLAKRALRQADPYEGLAQLYWTAEVSFARGDFHRFLHR